MTDELKPCPFCGRNAVWFKTGRDIGIECGDGFDCPGRAQTNVYGPEHRQDVIDQWNRRAAPEAAEPVAPFGYMRPADIEVIRSNRGGEWCQTFGVTPVNCWRDGADDRMPIYTALPTASQAGRDAVDAARYRKLRGNYLRVMVCDSSGGVGFDLECEDFELDSDDDGARLDAALDGLAAAGRTPE